MRFIKYYRGVGVGDIIKIDNQDYPNKKLAKVISIKKKNNSVYFTVQIAGKIILEVAESDISTGIIVEACTCKTISLLRNGCLCGGN